MINGKYILGIKQSLKKVPNAVRWLRAFKKNAKSYVLYGICFRTYDEMKFVIMDPLTNLFDGVCVCVCVPIGLCGVRWLSHTQTILQVYMSHQKTKGSEKPKVSSSRRLLEYTETIWVTLNFLKCVKNKIRKNTCHFFATVYKICDL